MIGSTNQGGNMTVAEAIEILKTFPQEYKLVCWDSECGTTSELIEISEWKNGQVVIDYD